MHIKLHFILITIFALFIASCSNAVEEASTTQDPERIVPVANPGEKQIVPKRSIVTLDASKSSSPSNSQLTYRWDQISGIPVVLSAIDESIVTFTAPGNADILRFRLVVEDSAGNISPEAFVNISVANHSPVADAGGDRNILYGVEIVLDASASFDADNDNLAYEWTYNGSNPLIILEPPNAITYTLPAPTTYGEIFLFTLKVADEENITDEIAVNLTVVSRSPFANAGDDQIGVAQESTVTLNGLKSSDPEQTSLTYNWLQIAGPPVVLDDSSSTTPSFVISNNSAETFFKFELTVNDGETDSAPDVVTVSVLDYAGESIRLTHNPFLHRIDIPPQQAYFDIKVVNNIAYAIDFDRGLRIIDITDPFKLVFLGSYEMRNRNPSAISIKDNFAYITAFNGGMEIVDISDPFAPIFAGNYATSARNLIINGNLGILGNPVGNIEFIEFSNPKSPTRIGSYDSQEHSLQPVNDIAFANDLVYIAHQSDIEIISIATPNSPANPALVGTYATTETTLRMDLIGTTLYSIYDNNGLHIIDVTTPSSLVVDKHVLARRPCGLQVANGVAYILDLIGGLTTVDVSVSNSTQDLAFFEAGFNCALRQWGNYLIMGHRLGITMLSIAKNYDDIVLKQHSIANISNIDISNNYLIATDGPNIFNFDISNAAQFVSAGLLTSTSIAQKLQYSYPLAYVLSGSPDVKLDIYDTRVSPFSLQGSHVLANSFSLADLVLDGDRPFIADTINGLTIMDLSTVAPQPIGSYKTSTFIPNKIAIEKGNVVTGYSDTLQLLDISDINNPSFKSEIKTVGAVDIEMSNNYIYTAAGDMHIFTITNNSLKKILSMNTSSRVSDLEIVNDDLFMAQTRITTQGYRSGFYIYDIKNHVSPSLKGRFIYAYAPVFTSVAINQNTAYVADRNTGIIAIPTGVKLNGSFNVTDVILGTTLTYEFQWPILSNVYDIVCKTSAGSCIVSGIDSINRTAVVNWTLPASGNNKNYGMYVAIGNYNYFLSSEEILFIP